MSSFEKSVRSAIYSFLLNQKNFSHGVFFRKECVGTQFQWVNVEDLTQESERIYDLRGFERLLLQIILLGKVGNLAPLRNLLFSPKSREFLS